MIIDLHLGVNAEHTLSYKLYDNAVTELFHKRLNAQENKVVSRTQFYNFGETGHRKRSLESNHDMGI